MTNRMGGQGAALVAIVVTLALLYAEWSRRPNLGAHGGVADPGPMEMLAFHSFDRRGAQDTLDFEVYREMIEPMFLVDRGGHMPGEAPCAGCHINSGTPMKLQPLHEDGSGRAYWTEEQSRVNYQVVSRLVTPGDPQRSRLLRKPLAVEAGGARSHVGGKFWDSQEHPEWQRMAQWVAAATAHPASVPTQPSPTPDFEFFRTCIQRIFLDREERQNNRLECVACHSGGGFRAFARLPGEGRDFWNEQESRANYGVIMELVEPGYPLRSRFLTRPLDPGAGGDVYHAGGRRWYSQDDPEWQMLADWVRGEPTTCAVTDR